MLKTQTTCLLALLAACLLPAPEVAAQTPAPDTIAAAPRDTTAASMSTITFTSGAEIYVGAGRQDGLVEGAEVYVIRRDSVVSTLRVKFLSSRQASCEILRGATDVAVGDMVRYYPQLSSAGTATIATRRRGPRKLSGPGIHGRFGTRYLRATTKTDTAGTELSHSGFNQPSFDVRINGLAIGGTDLGLAVDLRTRRTVTSSTGQSNRVDGHTRVYQASMFWGGPGAGFRTVVGRQYLSAVTSVSMFDGALLELNGSHLTFGAFGGVEPDPADLGFSKEIQDFGGYFQLHNKPASASVWSFSVGAVGSYTEGGHHNREFAFSQASFSNSYFSFYGLQEVDYYPESFRALGTSAIGWSSQYAQGSIRPARWLSFNGSYDRRQNVRLYRDAISPETQFDDAYRAGYGGGIQLTGRRVRLGGDWRHSTGGTAGGSNSYTGTFGLDRFTPLRLGFSARATLYQNQNDSTLANPGARRTTGKLFSGRLGFDPVSLIHVDLNAGLRREDNPNNTTMQKSTWYGADLDLILARAWFVSFSGLRQQDPGNPGTSTTTQLYSSITWRF